MNRRTTALGAWLLTAALVPATTVGAVASDEVPSHTPPRLALLEGDVSFWRASIGDWQKAPVNLPLAEGDVLATGERSRAELQLRRGLYLRLGSQSELQLAEQANSQYRFALSKGVVALDVQAPLGDDRIQIAAGDVELRPLREGYYRIELGEQQVRVVTRRGARAWISRGPAERELATDLELRLERSVPGGLPVATLAPPSDEWDQWNFRRSAQLLRARGRLSSVDLAGIEELDAYGEWRSVPAYGLVWFPRVPRVWVPYSTGRWIWDPVYGWTWVDFAPWGWVPFHYGRWVWVDGWWGWALGPPTPRLVYAPALVVFFVGKGLSVSVAAGPPTLAWVPLGWGEPCVPWWGPAWFVGRPWWGGWHGPRRPLVGGRFQGGGVLHADDFEHARERRGLLGVRSDRFGLFPVTTARTERVEIERLALPGRDIPRRPSTGGPAEAKLRTLPDGRTVSDRRLAPRWAAPPGSTAEVESAGTGGEQKTDGRRQPRRPRPSSGGTVAGRPLRPELPVPPAHDRWGPFAPEIKQGGVPAAMDEPRGFEANRVNPRPFVRDRFAFPRGVSGGEREAARPVRRLPSDWPPASPNDQTVPAPMPERRIGRAREGWGPETGGRPHPSTRFVPAVRDPFGGRDFSNLPPRRPSSLNRAEAVQPRGDLGVSTGGYDSFSPAPERRRSAPVHGEGRTIRRGH
ncbi:hypothetical protein HRbin30_01771 [bacterium HR30]|nr:hypothetical protein HRbin30_01771 [bacterium HR30]